MNDATDPTNQPAQPGSANPNPTPPVSASPSVDPLSNPAAPTPAANPAPAPVAGDTFPLPGSVIMPPGSAAPVTPTSPLPTAPPPAATPAPIDPAAAAVGTTATDTPDDSEAESGGSAVAGFFNALVRGIFNWIVVPAIIVLVLHFFVFQAFHVVGYSMTPTLDQADYLIISKLEASIARAGKLFGQKGYYYPARGEIIVFHYPKDPTLIFVKRTVGLPGDHVIVHAGKVTIINKAHPQGFDPDNGHQVADPVTLGEVDEFVPDGNVFVLGDNRTPNGSFDSRDWGDLPVNLIIGKAVLRLLPLNKFTILTAPKAG